MQSAAHSALRNTIGEDNREDGYLKTKIKKTTHVNQFLAYIRYKPINTKCT